jgi:cytidylate kinase
MYRIVTVAREYGSGGGPIATLLARQLGWELLDNALINKIAKAANVDRSIAQRYDECLDSWLHRLMKNAFSRGSPMAGAPVVKGDSFDAEAMAALSRRLIEEAAGMGNCVIVGRGAQCILQQHKDAFHVFIYAPMRDRVERVREAEQGRRVTASEIDANDKDRAAYVKHHFGCEWRNPHLYHAMFCASAGDETVARAIRCAMGLVNDG